MNLAMLPDSNLGETKEINPPAKLRQIQTDKMRSPAWTHLNSPSPYEARHVQNNEQLGTGRVSISSLILLKKSGVTDGSNMQSQPALCILNAAQQIAGESNSQDEICAEDDDPPTKVSNTNNKSVKSRNAKDRDASFHARSKRDLTPEHMSMGTILSEKNEASRMLKNADFEPISSPTKGLIERTDPDFQKIIGEFHELHYSEEEENILEQTLGKTLTQKKKILQEINSQTSKRRDYGMGGLHSDFDPVQSAVNQEETILFARRNSNQVKPAIKLLKLPQREFPIEKKLIVVDSREETQAADFSECEDSRAFDEATEVQRSYNQSAAKVVRQSQEIKTTPKTEPGAKLNASSGKEIGRKTVVPQSSCQTKNSTVRDQNKSFGANSESLKSETQTLKDQVMCLYGQKSQPELIMRLSNLNSLSGSVFLMPNFKQLTLVDVRNNRLTELPSELCTLSQLTVLKVDYNYLAALPFLLGTLSELQYLSASQNRLIELPDSLFRHDSKLHSLLVNDNKIGKIQRSLGTLRNLKQLYLHSNCIVEIPTSFSQLTKLMEFSLDWLAYIDKTVEELEEMAGFKQPQKEVVKEHIQTFTDAPASARKYFESNADEHEEEKGYDELALTQRRSLKTILREPKLPDIIVGNKKVLKGDKGILLVKELRLFCKLAENVYKTLPANRPHAQEQGKLHFVQFLMYFHNLRKLSKVKDFVFRHKQRTFLHQMGLNGHVYLLQASIAVLGMSRQATSFNVNRTDEDNSTALVLAIRQKRFEFVKYLLRLPQISTTIYSHKYGLPLHVALYQCEFKLALKLLKRQEQLKTPEEEVELDVNVPNEQGNTAMHQVFINFNQNPEMATLVAKILIKKGANLCAKNKNDLGLLHVAVQSGTTKALKFAIEHNQQYRKRHRKRLNAIASSDSETGDTGMFQFNSKAGSNNWTVLHFAIHAANLPLITFLLDSTENIDLNSRDSQGRRAIDLCPFSSPIFKSIRSQIERKILAQIQRGSGHEDSAPSQVDFSLPFQLRVERPKISPIEILNPTAARKSKGPSHRYLSARDCLVGTKPQHSREGIIFKKAEPIIQQQNFASINTHQSNASATLDEAYNCDYTEKINYKSIAVNLARVNTEDSRTKRMGDLLGAYGVRTPNIGNGQSSFADSLEDARFELFNSQAAAFPFPLNDQTKGSASKQDMTHRILETPTYIQHQPMNLSTESPYRAQESLDESADEFEQINQILSETNVEQVQAQSEHSENGENVDDENEQLGSKAFEARVSQWNRQKSTQIQEEKKLHQAKLDLTICVVGALEGLQTDSEEVRRSEEKKWNKGKTVFGIEEKENESDSFETIEHLMVNQAVNSCKFMENSKPTEQCLWKLSTDYDVYMRAQKLSPSSLRRHIEVTVDETEVLMPHSQVPLARFEVEQLCLSRENELIQQQTQHMIVINSTGRPRHQPALHGIVNYLQRTKSQSTFFPKTPTLVDKGQQQHKQFTHHAPKVCKEEDSILDLTLAKDKRHRRNNSEINAMPYQ